MSSQRGDTGVQDPTKLIGRSTLLRYLRVHGWALVGSKGALELYEKEFGGVPVVLPVPGGDDLEDSTQRLAEAARILAKIDGADLSVMGQLICDVGRDVFLSRVPCRGGGPNISLREAKHLVDGLAGLAEEAAKAEAGRRTKKARELSAHARFGHTRPGSFCLSLEIELPPPPLSPLAIEGLADPGERAISCRIVRGLCDLHRSRGDAAPDALINGSRSGLSGPMCRHLNRMITATSDAELYCSISWSPEYAVPRQLRGIDYSWRLDQESAGLLSAAADELERADADADTLRTEGRIVQLSSQDAPLESERRKDRAIVVAVDDPIKPWSLHVILSPEQYVVAIQEHMRGGCVIVSGHPSRGPQGERWITEPTDFLATGTQGVIDTDGA